MPSQLALAICCVFIAWLFVRDGRRRPQISSALWIPVIWAAILGSRPISLWLRGGYTADPADGYEEGNALDRFIFLSLILAGLMVLLRRRSGFREVMEKNSWVFVLCAYWGASVLWSDSPFVAFKRWIKDVGHIVMVLVILSERDPFEAIKATFARCTYLLIPLSVLVIKWYPGFGIYYNRWTGGSAYGGVTTNKNQLGITLAVCTVFIVWQLLQMRKRKLWSTSRIDAGAYLMLLAMAVWLFRRADSATSLACAALGACGIFLFDLPALRNRRERLLPYAMVTAVILMVLSMFLDLRSFGAEMLGRDASLHGRSEIWSMVLAEDINPLIGSGFCSFWSAMRVHRFLEVYSFHLTQAHNGYLETYVNGGLIALFLLVAMLIYAGRRLQKQFVMDTDFATVKLVFWIIIIIHNWTEASFNKLGLLWFVFLLVIMEYPRASRMGTQQRPSAARTRNQTEPVDTVHGGFPVSRAECAA